MRKPVKFRAGIVGAGGACAEHVAAIRRLPGVEIVGLYDLDTAAAQRASAELNVPVFPSIEALRHAGADVVHVLTPPRTRAMVAMAAMDQSCHVFLTNSAATDVADCRAMEATAAARGLQICVGHSLLFDPQICHALALVRRGKLGRIVAVDYLRSVPAPTDEEAPLPAQYGSAGGPFRDLGGQALYVFEAFLGPIEHVQADWKNLGGAPGVAFDEWRAQVRCRDGIAQCQLSWNVRPTQNQLIIQGTKGVLNIDLSLMTHSHRTASILPDSARRVLNGLSIHTLPLLQIPQVFITRMRARSQPNRGLEPLLREFYLALEAGAPAPVTLADVKRVVQWTERIARLADQDHHRRVLPLRLSDRVPVLVTGASSAVGQAIVARLRDDGLRARVLLHGPPDSPIDGIEVAVGDLADDQAVDRAVRGAEIVIHAGAATCGSSMQFRHATVMGTQNVVNACLAHGVKKLIYLSSTSILDWVSADRTRQLLCESSAIEPHPDRRDKDTRTTLEAEKIVMAGAREKQLPAIILRAGQIFGGRIPLLSAAVARQFCKRWIVLGDGRKQIPLVHIDDVVEAVFCAVDSSANSGEIVHLVGNAPPTQREVLEAALGPGARIWHVRRWMVLTSGAIVSAMLKMIGRASPISMYRLRAAMSRGYLVSNNRNLLSGWQPTVGLRAGAEGETTSARARARSTRSLPASAVLTEEIGAPIFDDESFPRAARA